jgi:hypothetical protein
MQHTLDSEALKPWYRQPWLWFLLSIPIASVILSSIMVTVAVMGRDSLVSDNYYKDGMAINQTIGQDQLAAALGLAPVLSIKGQEVVLALKATAEIPAQSFLTLKLLHPTVSAQDVIIQLLPGSDGVFLGELPQQLDGRRYLDLYAFDNSWRIREELVLPQNHQLDAYTLDNHLQGH